MSDDVAARLEQAETAARAKRYGEADGICRDVLASTPGCTAALGLRGSIAAIEGNVPLAIELLEEAVAAQPDHINWRSTLGDMYRMACRMDEALALAQQVVQARPKQPAYLVNLAKLLADRGDYEPALAHYLGVLALKPADANAHLGIGQILLARGEFKPGWMEYEWRNQLDQAKGRMPPIKAALWNGMSLPNGRLLLIGDQGFGDTLQFSRYIPLAAQRCKEVMVAGATDLRSLLETIDGVGRIFSRWGDIPSFSAYTLMSSLPYVFGTELATIPSPEPYITANPERVAHWRERLAAIPGGGRRVGLFWSGRTTHPNNLRRSMTLAQLRPLSAVPRLTLFSIQKQVGKADRAEMAAWPDLHDLTAELTDFGETAALMCNLDLVITVDSAVAHLAGALGRPVWVMLANPSDWRWMLGRTDTPWYASMRLFRQPSFGAWDAVVCAIVAALGELPV